MPDRDNPIDKGDTLGHAEPPKRIGMGRGYGRDFGDAGLDQGFDGSHGEGYGGSYAASDYRETFEATDRSSGPDPAGPYGGRGPKAWSRSDAKVREEICERLLNDRLLDARGIEVAVQEGLAILSGVVPGASDVGHAEMLTRRAAGVTDVRNELRCEPGLRRIDRPDHDEPLGQRTRWGKWIPPFTP